MAAKTSTKHPYAAIEHRVIDSPTYADLTFSARSLLVLITRQLTRDNNGRLQATFSYMRRFGFSVNTLSRGIAELISHGFLYRTRSGGYQQGAALYAVTWLSITARDDLFLKGFKACAWRDWDPANKKTPRPKLIPDSIKNGELTEPTTTKTEADSPPKTDAYELMPVVVINNSIQTQGAHDEISV